MLISFSIKNYKSFKSQQSYSLISSSSESLKNHSSSKTSNSFAPQISHLLGIFGANGAGKSNVIEAMDVMITLVLHSATKITKGDSLPHYPFKLNTRKSRQPTEFEVVFLHKGSIFQYGFSYDSMRVRSEWLYENPSKARTRTRHWFYREYDNKKKLYDWYVNPVYIKSAEKLKKGTRENSLFLSSGVRDNSESLFRPFSWFVTSIHAITAGENFHHEFTSKKIFDGEWKKDILELLIGADLRIEDVSVFEEKIDLSKEHLEKFSSEIRKLIIERSKEAKQYSTTFQRLSESGESISFDLEEESTGTQAFYSIAGPLLDVLQDGSTLIVDELHSNFHPHLMKQVLKIFKDPAKNKKGAQLIFSSHDSFVMREVLHEDQIWFVEKDTNGASEMYCLTDIKKKRTSNFAKSYLDGRYGAVPRIRY